MIDNDKLLLETHDMVLELKTVLLGKNGDKGLIGVVEKLCADEEELDDRVHVIESGILDSGPSKKLLAGQTGIAAFAASVIILVLDWLMEH